MNIINTADTPGGQGSRYLVWGLWMIALCSVFVMSVSNTWASDVVWKEIEETFYLEKGYDPIWTAEDYLNAEPVTPVVRDAAQLQQTKQVQNAVPGDAKIGLPKEHAGALPSVDWEPDLNNFIHPPLRDIETEKNQSVRYVLYNKDVSDGTFTAPPLYPNTSSTVNAYKDWRPAEKNPQEPGGELRVDTTWPYKTVGALFFKKQDNSSRFCSAAVIAHRLIVTAGQCVHSGMENGFHKDWRFVPAYRQIDGSAPFGTWHPRIVAVTSDWAGSGGELPNSADFAVLEMWDQMINTENAKNTGNLKIGDLLGYLGWKAQGLSETIPVGDTTVLKSHLTVVGYPHYLRFLSEEQQMMTEVPVNSLEMHQVTGPIVEWPNTNTYLFGTDWGNGSIGGPMVRYWGWTINEKSEKVMNSNYVVSVVSYLREGEMLQGGSQLEDSWRTELWEFVCNKNPGNCPPD